MHVLAIRSRAMNRIILFHVHRFRFGKRRMIFDRNSSLHFDLFLFNVVVEVNVRCQYNASSTLHRKQNVWHLQKFKIEMQNKTIVCLQSGC